MFNTILVPVDLAHRLAKRRALPVAVELARPRNGKLHLITVLPDYGMSLVGSYFPAEQQEDAMKNARAGLEEMAREYVPDEMLASIEVRRGSVYREILDAADATGCDTIVMAAHRPEMQDYLIGPNAAKVVRHAQQSVFVVRV